MNFEGVDVKISDFLLSSEAFVRIGSEHRREVAFPSVGTQEAASGRSYGLDLQDSHKIWLSNVLSWSAVPLATGRMNTTWKSRA